MLFIFYKLIYNVYFVISGLMGELRKKQEALRGVQEELAGLQAELDTVKKEKLELEQTVRNFKNICFEV